jgi:hypothetical protein
MERNLIIAIVRDGFDMLPVIVVGGREERIYPE